MLVEQLGFHLPMATSASSYLLRSRRDVELNSDSASTGNEVSVVRPLDHTWTKEAHSPCDVFATSKTV